MSCCRCCSCRSLENFDMEAFVNSFIPKEELEWHPYSFIFPKKINGKWMWFATVQRRATHAEMDGLAPVIHYEFKE